MEITLRKATLNDSDDVLSWRNEPTTIPWMGSAKPLSPLEHQDWFEKSLSDEHCVFFIIESDKKPIGQIRYHLNSDLMENTAKVSINITASMHGKGIASIAFRKGSEMIREMNFARNIFAYVLPNNIGSIKAMANAGFVENNIVTVRGVDHLIMLDLDNAAA